EVARSWAYRMMKAMACPYGDVAIRWFFREKLRAGLFDKNLKESGPARPLLLFHDDQTWPIGSSFEWDSQTDDGLLGTWKLDGSGDAQRAAQMAKDGHLTREPIGHRPV